MAMRPFVGSFQFTTVNNNYVRFGVNSPFTVGAAFTYLALIKVPNLPPAGDGIYHFLQAGPYNTQGERRWLINAVGSSITQRFAVGRATTNTVYNASTTLTVGRWYWMAGTYSQGASPEVHLYQADVSAGPFAEVAYSTSTNGSGASTYTATSGAIGDDGGAFAAPVRIAFVMIVNSVLSLGQLRSLQRELRCVQPCVALLYPGRDGATAMFDRSGSQHQGDTFSNNVLTNDVPSIPGLEIFQ